MGGLPKIGGFSKGYWHSEGLLEILEKKALSQSMSFLHNLCSILFWSNLNLIPHLGNLKQSLRYVCRVGKIHKHDTVHTQASICSHLQNHLHSKVLTLRFNKKLRSFDFIWSFLEKWWLKLTNPSSTASNSNVSTNHILAWVEEKVHLAQNWLHPRHLLTLKVPKKLLNMRDHTTITNKVS